MKYHSEEEIIKEVEDLKVGMKAQDFQMGIGGATEKIFFNKINKILRMLKSPVRKVEFRKKIKVPKKATFTTKYGRKVTFTSRR